MLSALDPLCSLDTPRGRVTIASLSTPAALQTCEQVQRVAWRYGDIDIVSAHELLFVARAGGIVLGAFSEEAPETLVGFCFGLLARDPMTSELYHLSRMLAVVPAYKRFSIATALKYAQAERARAQGLECMRWTFDPLATVNGHFNLNTLGAVVDKFHRDFFGPESSSPLHLGGTDRFEVCWRFGAGACSLPATWATQRIAVPRRWSERVNNDPNQARALRHKLRPAIEAALASGLVGFGLEAEPDSDHVHYLFGPPPQPQQTPSQPQQPRS